VQEKKPLTFCETRVKGDSNLKQLHSLWLSGLQSLISFFTSRVCVYSDHSTSVSEVGMSKHTTILPPTHRLTDIPFQTVSKMFPKHEQKRKIYKWIFQSFTHFISIFVTKMYKPPHTHRTTCSQHKTQLSHTDYTS
jgi:hypothetical protein